MTEPASPPLPVPGPACWTWGPSRKGLGGYGGTCTHGPMTFAVTVNRRYDNGWELQAACTLAGVKTATQSWKADSLSCTPDGIVSEVAGRDVLRQLAGTTRARIADAARLLEEFDVLRRAGATEDERPG
ncbi:hypothetical protein CU254_40995 (plasmid) [Amycolatopsis sp. AA4]|uniref:hypothetical protein n=1 Tax=Actinomycetes TaxID=1760 RepID=UPI0001B56183|nr:MULTISPECIES: hypothetical protein [Actinomycetes]ATY16972.1 hypothetical protein CU254_40995 [Amycolatopsis sp. AA4]EFL12540.1 hypothetical protein SSMG_08212 [Streptomyces sp. AA4]